MYSSGGGMATSRDQHQIESSHDSERERQRLQYSSHGIQPTPLRRTINMPGCLEQDSNGEGGGDFRPT